MSKKVNAWHGVVQTFKFARQEWKLIAVAVLTMLAYSAGEGAYLALARPVLNAFSKAMKDINSVDLSAQDLIYYGKIALLMAPIVALTAAAQSYMEGRTVWRLTVLLRNTIARAILPQSLTFFEGRRSGDLMSRITNDVTRTRTTFLLLFSDVPQQFLHVLMGLGISVYMNWRLLIVSAVAIPAVLMPIGYMARRIRKYGREGLEKLADLTDLMAQMFSGIRVIKAFKMEDAELLEFERVNEKLFSKRMKVAIARAMSQGAIELVIRLALGAGALVAAWAILHSTKEIDTGGLVACLGGMYYSFQGIRKLVKSYNELQEVIPAADRIFELIEYVPELRDAPDAVAISRMEKGVAFRDVSFSYGGDPVLINVSFEAKRGERIAVVGRSGAGKSTLIALLCRFYEVSSGTVEIDGLDVRRITNDSLLNRFAIVTQQTFLFNRSIIDNIRYGKRNATREEVEQAAKDANIHEFIVGLPDGYDTMCGEYGAKLSGGQRQRIAIARALLKDAEILILDEAMVGLDKESENVVSEAMERLMQGRTVFTISHDLPTIQNADLILVLESGRLVGKGKHADLLKSCEEYRDQYALQFGVFPGPAPDTRPLSEF